jgi:hypothetical protein
MKPFSRSDVRLFVTTVYILLALISISCSTDLGDDFVATGTIVYVSLEGGFYGIKGDDGKAYDPLNLPAEYQENGLRVRFEAKELKNLASFHMWGVIVTIVHIQSL